jgi:putative DNA primase/helicase
MTSPFHDAAIALARCGYAVFPLKPGGKTPITAHGFKDGTVDEAKIGKWWKRHPDANIGIATGDKSGVLVVDVDGDEGAQLLRALTDQSSELPPTIETKTGNGGRHLIFALPYGCGKVPSSKGDGLDIRADGGYIVAPPSLIVPPAYEGDDPNGGRYEWVDNGVDDAAIAPHWVVAFAKDRKAVLKAVGVEEQSSPTPRPNGQQQPGLSPRPNGAQPPAGKAAALLEKLKNVETPDPPPPYSPSAVAELIEQLRFIGSDDRDIWLKVGGALHDYAKDDPQWAGPNRQIWDAWSKLSRKFDEKDQEKNWRSFAREYTGRRATKKTIRALAEAGGWVGPDLLDRAANVEAWEKREQERAEARAQEREQAPEVQPKGVDFGSSRRTGVGNAAMFCAMFGHNVRYVEAWKSWLVWDGHRWVEKSSLAMLEPAKRAIWEMMRWAFQLQVGSDDRKMWTAWALSSEFEPPLRSMLNLASASLIIKPDALDADAWLLGCPNGTLDLRTGQLREARREDFITKQIGVAFDPTAKCPEFIKFLGWAMDGDSTKIKFIQTFIGYCLTGDVSEEIMCVFYGDGDNGKSTTTMLLYDLLGDYAGKAQSDLLVHAQGKEGSASPDLAKLLGLRLVIVSETEDGCLLSEGQVKYSTSNVVITARKLHKDPFTFPPTHKILLETNYRPRVRGTDDGIWRRLALAAFMQKIAEADKVTDFRERVLKPELSGILNFALEGLARWKCDGLRQPEVMRNAVAEYRSQNDDVAQWIEERTVRDPESVVLTRQLHDDYVNWLGPQDRDRAFKSPRFAEELERKGFHAERGKTGARARRGIRLKTERSVFEVFAQYLAEHLDETLTMPCAPEGRRQYPIIGETPRRKVSIRIETDTETCYVSIQSLRAWLERNSSSDLDDMLVELARVDMLKLREAGKLETHEIRCALTAGTSMAGGQIPCIVVDIGNPALTGKPRAVREDMRKDRVFQNLQTLN